MGESEAALKKTIHSVIWNQITAFSSLALAIVGLVALIFTWIQINEMRNEARVQIGEMREEARVQHLTALIDKFDSPDRVAIRKSLALKRIDKTQGRLRLLDVNNAPIELYDELGLCEDIGLLTERGYLDRHDVWNSFGSWLAYLYADARPLLDSEQKISPAEFQKCSSLVESIRLIEAKEDLGADDHPSESDIYNSYLSDSERPAGQPMFRGRKPRRP
jgi:hypothetical protein